MTPFLMYLGGAMIFLVIWWKRGPAFYSTPYGHPVVWGWADGVRFSDTPWWFPNDRSGYYSFSVSVVFSVLFWWLVTFFVVGRTIGAVIVDFLTYIPAKIIGVPTFPLLTKLNSIRELQLETAEEYRDHYEKSIKI